MPAFLKKKVAGLPVGAWLLIIGAGVGLGLYLRKRNAEAAAESDGTDTGAGTGLDTYASQYSDYSYASPYDYGYTGPAAYLPSTDYGAYPMTGGGAPVVPEAMAIRFEDPLRIVLKGKVKYITKKGAKKKKKKKKKKKAPARMR